MSNYHQLLSNFDQQSLYRIEEYFFKYLEVANNQSIPFTETLLELISQELLYKQSKKVERALLKALSKGKANERFRIWIPTKHQ
uniref:hypothetical protein n=1 Tax=Enterococcus pseudoavium TaxID=44007 RepID=UPI002892D259|nr:hypothetical protein [Enterococcus pseudoavium]